MLKLMAFFIQLMQQATAWILHVTEWWITYKDDRFCNWCIVLGRSRAAVAGRCEAGSHWWVCAGRRGGAASRRWVISYWRMLISSWKMLISSWKVLISSWKMLISCWRMLISSWKCWFPLEECWFYNIQKNRYLRGPRTHGAQCGATDKPAE